MHLLMIAPQPFFEPRGTPFSEFHRIRALTTLGHTVDLVTYPFGEDVALPGLRIHRCLRPPFVRRIRIGPSWAKVPLDLTLALTVLRLAATRRYDAVHSHEEGGGIGVVVARLLRIPHLYDMHSSLPQQIHNFGYRGGRWVIRFFDWLERLMIRHSRVVVVICPQLKETVRAIDARVPVVLIENAAGSGKAPTPGEGLALRARMGLAPGAPAVVYTGTFERYQGLDLLFDAAVVVRAARPEVRFVLVGGEPAQVEEARRECARRGLADAVVFVGQRPADEVPAYLDAADVLVSPRSTGTNTPLKLYQYLRAGKPIVATRLLTHTQVLDDETAFLAAPDAAAFGRAILDAATDSARAAAVGARARALAASKYSEEIFVARTRAACDALVGAPTPAVAGGLA